MSPAGTVYPLLAQAWRPHEVDELTPFDLALLLTLREFGAGGRGI